MFSCSKKINHFSWEKLPLRFATAGLDTQLKAGGTRGAWTECGSGLLWAAAGVHVGQLENWDWRVVQRTRKLGL